MSGILEKVQSHKKTIIILTILVLGGGYYYNTYINVAPVATKYVLAKAEKGMLVVSVSGAGQVSSLDQIDVKSQVSGNLIKVNIIQGQEVKKDAILAQVNSSDAVMAVSNAQVSLATEKKKLDDMLLPLDAQTLIQDENAVAQAQNDLEKAEDTYNNINTDTEKTLADAYDSGYSQVSSILFSLSNYMVDLKSVRGIDKNRGEQEYMTEYGIILGEDSSFIKKVNDDFNAANDFYNKNTADFINVFRNSKRDIIYDTISNTLNTTKAISQSLESARHMYDAISVQGYSGSIVAAAITKTQPKIQSDLSAIFSNITTLQSTIDTIDNTIKDTPANIKNAELAYNSAKANLSAKQQILEDFQKGVDPIDIRHRNKIICTFLNYPV